MLSYQVAALHFLDPYWKRQADSDDPGKQEALRKVDPADLEDAYELELAG